MFKGDGPSEIAETLKFVERHGYVLLFFWVLAEQSAIPVPSVPLLLATGALIHAGRLRMEPAIVSCLLAALIADSVWFGLGRRGGRQVLRLLCRLSLEPDSCVRQTENAFVRYGMRSLLVSRFIPGLNTVAAPLAGYSKTKYIRFALYDMTGALIWSGVYLTAGYIFSEQLEVAVRYASRLGANVVLVILGVFAGWIAWKFLQRRLFLRKLEIARMMPEELQKRLAAGEELFIVDLRSSVAQEPALIPGALACPRGVDCARQGDTRDREIILFCS